jgi:hypothetical protein
MYNTVQALLLRRFARFSTRKFERTSVALCRGILSQDYRTAYKRYDDQRMKFQGLRAVTTVLFPGSSQRLAEARTQYVASPVRDCFFVGTRACHLRRPFELAGRYVFGMIASA